MTHMMSSYGPGLGMLAGLHFVGGLAFVIGMIFLIVLAVRKFNEKQLKKWAIGLLVLSLVACLVTIGVRKQMWSQGGMMMGKGGAMNMMYKDANGSKYSGEMMGNSMKGMTMMLQGKTGDEFDAAFLAMMIPHHEGAIEMAKLAETSAAHAEIKALAKAIIKAQQTEIDQMEKWQTTWNY